jgi:hypothetical protein
MRNGRKLVDLAIDDGCEPLGMEMGTVVAEMVSSLMFLAVALRVIRAVDPKGLTWPPEVMVAPSPGPMLVPEPKRVQ